MTAHLYSWARSLELDPQEPDFHQKIAGLHQAPRPLPSPRLIAFVKDLQSRYADLTETEDTIWGDGPLVNNILGEFINMSLSWSRYAEGAPFVIETAYRHGLHCYDPQGDNFYPAPPN